MNIPQLMLAIVFGLIGLGLAVFVAGKWWGALIPAVFAAAVPFVTQRGEIKLGTKATAKSVAAAAAHTASIANAPYDPDAKRSHSNRNRYAVVILLLVLTIACAAVQVKTQQPEGWWLVAGCVPLCLLFFYVAWQWCIPRSNLRALAAGAAMWSLGLSGNFFASAVTGGTCATQAQTTLSAPLSRLSEGISYVVAWTRRIDDKIAKIENSLARLEARSRSSQDAVEHLPLRMLGAEEVAALENIATVGTSLQQARAILVLAQAGHPHWNYEAADLAIARVEAERQKGLWNSRADDKRYLLLKADRIALAGDPDGGIGAYEAALEKYPDSADLWSALGMAHFCTKAGDIVGHKRAARDALEKAIALSTLERDRLASLFSNLAQVQLSLGETTTARQSIERGIELVGGANSTDYIGLSVLYSGLAASKSSEGDLQGALGTLDEAVRLIETHYDANHPTLAVYLSDRSMYKYEEAMDLIRRGEVVRARQVLESSRRDIDTAIDVTKRHYGIEFQHLAIAYSNLSLVQGAQGDPRAACVSMQAAIRIGRSNFDRDHASFSTNYYNLSGSQARLGMLDDALVSLEESIRVHKVNFGDDPKELFRHHLAMARILQAQGKYAEARPLLEALLKLEDGHGTSILPNPGLLAAELAQVCRLSGDTAAACENYRVAVRILRSWASEDDPTLRGARQGMMELGCSTW